MGNGGLPIAIVTRTVPNPAPVNSCAKLVDVPRRKRRSHHHRRPQRRHVAPSASAIATYAGLYRIGRQTLTAARPPAASTRRISPKPAPDPKKTASPVRRTRRRRRRRETAARAALPSRHSIGGRDPADTARATLSMSALRSSPTTAARRAGSRRRMPCHDAGSAGDIEHPLPFADSREGDEVFRPRAECRGEIAFVCLGAVSLELPPFEPRGRLIRHLLTPSEPFSTGSVGCADGRRP